MWFPENAPPGSIVMVPTLDMDISRRFFGREFVHALPTMHQPGPLYLRHVRRRSPVLHGARFPKQMRAALPELTHGLT